MAKSSLIAFLVKELKEVLPPTLFFAIGFNLIVLTTDLILADYLKSFANYLVATVTALVVGKAVLVANAIPHTRRFDSAPRFQAVLFKTGLYWSAVFVVRFLERLVEYFSAGGTLNGVHEYVITHFSWHRFAAIQIWIFVLFLVYTSLVEVNAALGSGGLFQIFFGRRTPGVTSPAQVANSSRPAKTPPVGG